MHRWAGAVLTLMLLAGCTGGKGETGGMHFDTARDYEAALKSGKPTLVEFSATWCTICMRMQPVVERMEAKYGNRVNFVILNFDREKALVEKFGIRGTPTFILLNSSGEVVGGAVGYIPEDRFEEMIVELLEK